MILIYAAVKKKVQANYLTSRSIHISLILKDKLRVSRAAQGLGFINMIGCNLIRLY